MTTNEKFEALLEADDTAIGRVVRTPYQDGAKYHLCHPVIDMEMDITRLVTDTASEFKV